MVASAEVLRKQQADKIDLLLDYNQKIREMICQGAKLTIISEISGYMKAVKEFQQFTNERIAEL